MRLEAIMDTWIQSSLEKGTNFVRREVIFCACFRVTSDEYVYEEESDKRVRAPNTFRTIHRWGIHNRENVLGFGSKRKRDSLICMRMYRDTFPIAKKNLICRFSRKRGRGMACLV